MKVVSYICDKCGKEIKDSKERFKCKLFDAETFDNQLIDDEKDFCPSCAKEIVEFVDNIQTAPKKSFEEPVLEEIPKPEKLNSAIDTNKKIHELIKEGWSDEEIMKAKGCSKISICNSRRKLIKEEQTQQKKIDVGKVIALKNAGWSIAAIADELRADSNDVAAVING